MMTENKRVVLFDIDHTLRDASRRDHLIDEARRTNIWEPYHEDSINDGVCHDVLEMLNAFRHCGFPVMGCTAVPSKFRNITVDWLKRERVMFDDLLMNPRYSWEPSAQLKIGMVRERFGPNFASKILMIVDDHPDVIQTFQAHGVTGMRVHGRSYAPVEIDSSDISRLKEINDE